MLVFLFFLFIQLVVFIDSVVFTVAKEKGEEQPPSPRHWGKKKYIYIYIYKDTLRGYNLAAGLSSLHKVQFTN